MRSAISPDSHDADGAEDGADELDHQEVAGVLVGVQRDPAQREHCHQMEQGEAGQRHEGADQDVATLRLQHVTDTRCASRSCRLVQPTAEFLRHHHAQAGEQGDDVDREGARRRDSASPRTENPRRQVHQTKNANSAAASMKPIGAPNCGIIAYQPRLDWRRVERQQRGQSVPGAAQRQALSRCGTAPARQSPRCRSRP
jgi:hypothetical protein